MITLQQLFKAVVEQGATDLHIVANAPPALRVNGQIVRVKHADLTPEETKQLCYSILTDVQKSRFEESKELDFSFGVKKFARFRGNMFYQKGAVSGSFRKIPYEIPQLANLGLPSVVGELVNTSNGLILVTGPTGSGKTTTIAAMIDKLNTEKHGHIVTIEDPIEYMHMHKQCIVNQREVGPDTWSLQAAVRSLLRQDPDFAAVGELRDLETIEEAIRIAETGHLVFGTLHTNSAAQTINRIVSVFPSSQQERIRVVLSFVLQGVISQMLLPGIDGSVCLAYEILIPTPAVRNLIRENKLHQVQGLMQVGQNTTGMVTMNQSLLSLLMKRKIDMPTAFSASPDPEELDRLLRKTGV